MRKKGKSVSLYVNNTLFKASAHGSESCVSCHKGLNPELQPHAKKIQPVQCTECHSDDKFVHNKESVHCKHKGDSIEIPCQGCHTAHSIQKITDKNAFDRKQVAVRICARCHASVNEQYLASDHGIALKSGLPGAPSCTDCHGVHNVLSIADTTATTSRGREDKMCLGCHQKKAAMDRNAGSSSGFIGSYENSIHHQAISHGNFAAATCTDCHGSHAVKKGSDPSSSVSRRTIAATCGKCHAAIKKVFDQSIHGKSLAAGVAASATCTDCHGEHNILSPKNPLSPVAVLNVSAQVCSPCHSSVKLSQKYGLRSDLFKSFADSYHGLAGKSGSVEVANCASCHGFHDIKPSSDPTSSINKNNLAKTCGVCHKGANNNFARGTVHIVTGKSKHDILYYIATVYILLIVFTIGGMVLHNIFDFLKKSRLQLMYRRGIIKRKHHKTKLYLRMSLNERIQHGTLVLSFMSLVVTGFALHFPDAWWVAPVFSWFPPLFEVRSLFHRIAGMVLLGISLYHVFYVCCTPRGRELIRDLFPVWKDVMDFFAMAGYFVGLVKTKPKFGRFSYVEKAEYWALIWGTIIMGSTGLLLWFDTISMGIITKLGLDIARTIHYYEAWLATLAIFVWHFYFVIFNPDSYPLNLAFWKGTLTEEEMETEHPLELEKIKSKEDGCLNGTEIDGKK
jgi:cytochrome b subunit of formate dehydrogenase